MSRFLEIKSSSSHRSMSSKASPYVDKFSSASSAANGKARKSRLNFETKKMCSSVDLFLNEKIPFSLPSLTASSDGIDEKQSETTRAENSAGALVSIHIHMYVCNE